MQLSDLVRSSTSAFRSSVSSTPASDLLLSLWMNNPFERDRTASATAINNPFDTNPSSARNRFPDISQSNLSPPTSPSPAFQQSSPWTQQSSDFYSQMASQPQLQSPSYFGPSSYTAASQFTATPRNPMQFGSAPAGGSAMYANSGSGFAAGVASGGSYTSSPSGTTTHHFSTITGGIPTFGGGPGHSLGTSPYITDASSRNLPQNQHVGLHPQLSQFDPLSPSRAGQASFAQQRAYGAGANGYQSQQSELDPGPLVWHPRNPGAGVQVVTGFNGQTTVHAQIRSHHYSPSDHPRNVIAAHRVELEQWDQYGWRQSLNSLESLRIAWEHLRDDVFRHIDIAPGLPEKAVYRKVCPSKIVGHTLINLLPIPFFDDAIDETGSKRENRWVFPCPPPEIVLTPTFCIDSITAAYLQMQEVYSSYRQSPDASSKKRVRECLNAGLRSLPDWP